MNHKDFIYKKVQILEETGTYYLWYLIHRETRTGVHFHGKKYTDEFMLKSGMTNQYFFYAYGLEKHSKTPNYEGHTPIENCEVTGGDCYCDGSSLMASERLGFVNPDSEQDEKHIWFVLHDLYESWF